MFFKNKFSSLNKRSIFITGTPRSGTSMLTKVIDSHPDIIMLMENIFSNRRRLWERSTFWDDEYLLKKELNKIYSKFKEPIIGNKVITPDVWSTDDIIQFVNSFSTFDIIFIIRNPIDVFKSRYRRENYESEFNTKAKQRLHLDFSKRTLTYASSWRQNIENFHRLKDLYKKNVHLVYYDDLIVDFEYTIKNLFVELNIPFHDNVLNWHEFPHPDAYGVYKKNLKYKDQVIKKITQEKIIIPDIEEAIQKMGFHYELWKNRQII